MRRKRVCCYCEKWESGGIESFLSNLLLSMELTDLEVDLVAARLGESVFTAALKAHGVRFYELSGRQNEIIRNHRAFRKLLRERQYDVVHLNLFQGLSLAYARLAKEAGVPVRIAHSHNTALRKSATRPLKLALHEWGSKRYKEAATHRWACSTLAAEFLFGSAGDFTFIPNGIDTERFRFNGEVRAQVRKELGLEEALVVGNVGRLCGQKNQSFLLEVFQEVRKLCPESVLLLVGEGEDKPRLAEKAERLGLKDSVVFYGATDKVERLYWAMDVFVMPSLFEGLPVTGIEAQAAGLPCVFSEAVTEECRIGEEARFLSLSAPAKEWARAVMEAEREKDRRRGTDAVRRAGFERKDVSRRIKDFYVGADEDGRAEDLGDRAGL